METENIVACNQCKYYKKTNVSECWYPDVLEVNYVTGELTGSFCHIERGYESRCGTQGKWFEPKQSFWQEFTNLFK